MELSIIIVNWNSAAYVRQCLRSLARHAPTRSHEIIIVDSGSFDACGEMLAREFPTAIFVQSSGNIGFASANNLGAARAQGRYLLFLNPDTEVHAGAVDQLLQTLDRHPGAGLAGARLLNADGSLQTSCVQAFPTLLNQLLDSDVLYRALPLSPLWGIAALSDQSPGPKPVEVISGACLLVRRAVFEIVKGFDQRFFMYSEDLDLCYRVKQAGFDRLYDPAALITHHGGGSSNSARSMFSVVMTRESVRRFFSLNRGPLAALGYRVTTGLAAFVRLPLVLGLGMVKRKSGGKNFSAVKKWFAILRWSFGLESWAARKTGSAAGTPVVRSGNEIKPSCVA
ncbi:MAG: glycosyltransferase family 2 protein [Verrucomicrobiota bacterium]